MGCTLMVVLLGYNKKRLIIDNSGYRVWRVLCSPQVKNLFYITHHTISKLAFDTLKYRMPCISVSFYSALTLSKSTKEVFDLRRA
jgi:hypothetical protein